MTATKFQQRGAQQLQAFALHYGMESVHDPDAFPVEQSEQEWWDSFDAWRSLQVIAAAVLAPDTKGEGA